jgi:hypothetical protein
MKLLGLSEDQDAELAKKLPTLIYVVIRLQQTKVINSLNSDNSDSKKVQTRIFQCNNYTRKNQSWTIIYYFNIPQYNMWNKWLGPFIRLTHTLFMLLFF